MSTVFVHFVGCSATQVLFEFEFSLVVFNRCMPRNELGHVNVDGSLFLFFESFFSYISKEIRAVESLKNFKELSQVYNSL